LLAGRDSESACWRHFPEFAAGVRQLLVQVAQDRQFQPTKGGMHAIALQSNCTAGEWVVWLPTDDGDAAWAALGEAFAGSRLPACTSAKIGYSEYKGMYVIAVTTADYRNLMDVKDSFDQLQTVGLLGAKFESGYRMECLQYTGLCRTHDGDSRSITSNGMELNFYRTDNVSTTSIVAAVKVVVAVRLASAHHGAVFVTGRSKTTMAFASCRTSCRRATTTLLARHCAGMPTVGTAGSRATAGAYMPAKAPR
jgi:hypothetical protein